MYTISCDGYPLLDLRNPELILVNPIARVEVNTVGEASFKIYKNHPYYGKMQKLKSVFEIADEIGVIFRGRMTEDTIDFYNGKAVDLEGAMAFFNDSIIRPYSFPDDFLENEEYITASESGNVVEFFLNWLIEQHNSQVQDFQKFKLGNVTVSDPNNYITRSDTGYTKTWEVIKQKLFDSALGGFLCIRYEKDGNYIDYLSEFTLTNTQDIVLGENLLDLNHTSDATASCSAIIPIGADVEITSETETAEETGEETTSTEKKIKLTIASLADGDITDDIVKNGDTLYSKSAVENLGWIYAPVSDTTWDDVTEAQNLLTKGVEWLATKGVMLSDTVDVTAVDLHCTDAEIRSFRIYRKINVVSKAHEIDTAYNLTKLDIDILNPQNTKITVGETKLTLTDQNSKDQSDNIQKIEETIKDLEDNRTEIAETKNQMLIQKTEILNTCKEIILAASEEFVETGEYEEFRQKVEAQFQILADEITMKFTETTTQIENVDGDLQETNTTLSKFFEFTLDGLVIRSGESSITLHIDNDMIMFKKNGVMFGWWDGVDFHTGNIVVKVNERAQFGNFAFVPRSDGSLSFLKVDSEILVNKIINLSVVYSGGDATIGTSKNDLLTNIVVTATYSDGTTKDVTEYTLSGNETIIEGSNIYTVTYESKTSRFAVTGIPPSEIVLGAASNCVALAWLSDTTSATLVSYSDTVDVVDGVVTLENPQRASFYMTTATNYSLNDYSVLLGKYVDSFTGDIYYISPDATWSHNKDVSTYVKENITYNPSYLVSPAEEATAE